MGRALHSTFQVAIDITRYMSRTRTMRCTFFSGHTSQFSVGRVRFQVIMYVMERMTAIRMFNGAIGFSAKRMGPDHVLLPDATLESERFASFVSLPNFPSIS